LGLTVNRYTFEETQIQTGKDHTKEKVNKTT